MTRHVSRWLARVWTLLQASARAVGVMAGGAASAYVILDSHNVAVGSGRAAISVVVMLVAIPILGFTVNQMALTSKGRKVASTVKDVQILKQSDAAAFTQPFAAIIRKLPAQQVYPEERMPMPRAIDADPDREPRALPDPRHEYADTFGTARLGRSLGGRQPVEPPATSRFWESLTKPEQKALAEVARYETFSAGFVLWYQHQYADYVLVIRSGQVDVFAGHAAEKLIIATRGPGDIVGERAALHTGKRSAAVVAASTVEALVISTEYFTAFIADHPRVLDILEDQIYGRLTEDRSIPLTWKVATTSPRTAGQFWTGQNCSICLTDITAFSGSFRNDQDRMTIRRAMYRMLADAFNGCGIPWSACYREDRGDGALIVIPPGIPTRAVVDAVVTRLAAALKLHNENALDPVRIQLRVAVHVGPVTADPQGISGYAINQTARFIEAPPLKKGMVENAADLGFATSEFVYDTVISQAAESTAAAKYRKTQFQMKRSRNVAWIYFSESDKDPRCVRK